MTADIEKMKALALAATKGPWMRLFGERTVYDRMEDGCRGNVIVRADVAFDNQDANNLDFIAAANPASVLELIAEVERLRAVMKQVATGYESGFFASSPRDLDGKFTLHYESPQEAEAAFEALTSAIEAELPSRGRAEGGNTSADVSVINYGNPVGNCAAPAAGTVERDAERWQFRKQFLATGGAIMFTVSGCQLRRAGELIASGVTEEEAIDAAIAAHTKAAKEPT